jgi:hypothetical protein
MKLIINNEEKKIIYNSCTSCTVFFWLFQKNQIITTWHLRKIVCLTILSLANDLALPRGDNTYHKAHEIVTNNENDSLNRVNF